MQEEVTQRTVALCVEATKLSAGMLQQAMKKVLDEMQKGVTGHKTKLHHGKQTLRQLMKHNTGVSNIEITDQNIRAFSATAKKYGIDFALKKDTSGEIPRYLVFFRPLYFSETMRYNEVNDKLEFVGPEWRRYIVRKYYGWI